MDQTPTASIYINQELNQPNAAPTFKTTAPTAVVVNTAYSYQVFTSANPQATYTLTAAPQGMTIDPNTGLLSWSPGYSGEGIQTVTIQASNYAGQTAPTYSLDVVPVPPTGLTAAGASTSSVALNWTASPDPNVTSYDVYQEYHYGKGGTSYGLIGSGVTGTSFTVTGLQENGPGGGWYTFLIKAVNSAGLKSAYSTAVTTQTLYRPIFGAP